MSTDNEAPITGSRPLEWNEINRFAYLDALRGGLADKLRGLDALGLEIPYFKTKINEVPVLVEFKDNGAMLCISIGTKDQAGDPILCPSIPRNWINEPGT